MQQRIDWIDRLKGIAILLVIIGHALRPEMLQDSAACYVINKIIYTFHMPLFIAVSGFLFEFGIKKAVDKGTAPFIMKKSNNILKPFIVYSALIYIVFLLAYMVPKVKAMLSGSSYGFYKFTDYFLECFAGDNPYAFHLWYLYALFIIEIVIFTICINTKKSEMSKWICIIAFAAAIWLVRVLFLDEASMIIKAVTKYVIYFVFGMGLYKFKDLKSNKIIYAVLCVFAWAFCIWKVIYKPEFDSLLMTLLFELVLFAVICIIIKNIFDLAKVMPDIKALSYTGKNSLVIYLFHQPFCCGFVGTVLYSKIGVGIIPTVVICMLLSYAVPLAIYEITKRNKYTALLMKKVFSIS